MRVVFMGTPEFAVPSLEYLLDQFQVVAVYTAPDRVAGRGRTLASSPVKKAALNRRLPVVQPAGFKRPEAVAELAALKPDVIVVAAYGKILPQSVLDIPAYGCLNIHPSLLPEFRGATPVASAILAGKEFTGVSIMLLDSGMDTGPVLTRAQIPVSAEDTTASLTAKLSRIAAQLLLDVLPRWVRNQISPRPQDEAAASYSRRLDKQDGEIDWQLPAVDIWRRVRAFQPWPGCFTRWRGRQLKILEAEPLPVGDSPGVGLVVVADNGESAFAVGTGQGILKVLRVQMEGKQAVAAADFMRGQRRLIGSVLPAD